MEVYHRDLRTKGVTLDTDSSAATRLSQRPSQRKGAAFEDLGSDFSRRSSSRTSQPRHNERTNSRASSSKRTIIELSDDGSDDEIDFLSSSSRHGSESPVKSKRAAQKPESMSTPTIAIDYHQRSSGYKPLNLKAMKIPKKSSSTSTAAGPPCVSQNSHTTGTTAIEPSSASLDSGSKPGVSSAQGSTLAARHFVRDEGSSRPLRERSPNQRQKASPRSLYSPWDDSSGEEDKADKTPRQSTYGGTARRIAKSQTVAEVPSRSSQGSDKQKHKHQSAGRSKSLVEVLNSLQDQHDDNLESPPRSKGKSREVAGASKPKKGDATGASKMSVSSKGKQRAENPIDAVFEEKASSKAAARPRKKQPSEFPMPPPLSSPITSRASSPPHRNLPKSKHIVISSDEEGRSLRPFPMETQVLRSLARVSPAKRAADGSDMEDPGGGLRKRSRRNSREKELDSFAIDGEDSDSDLDDIFLDPSVDPATLCPWCDEPLPPHPTPHLTSLIEGARRWSYPDDRPTNPLGLRAAPMVFVSVCQRHRFERVWIPRARKRGWPTSIDWGRLRGRIERLKGELKAIIDDIDEDFVPESECSTTTNKQERAQCRPRKENEFWQDVVKNVRQQGSRQTTGVRGQFLHFNKTQPGYYGELGYMIIHQTLCDLFPPASFDPIAALPLTPADFIAHVLVPEAALNLIMEDLNLSRGDALKTLRDSVEYGVAMFPVDEGENGRGDEDSMVIGAGERMILERARARRKELEEEERIEEDEARSAHEAAHQGDTEPDMDIDSDGPPPPSPQAKKLKPRPEAKGKSSSSEKPTASSTHRTRSRSKTLDSDCEIVASSSDAGYRSDVSRLAASRKQRDTRHDPPPERSEARLERAEPHGNTPRAKPKPRPRAIGKSGMASSSQPDIVANNLGKTFRRLPDSSDDDGPPPLTQRYAPALSPRKNAVNGRRIATDGSPEATPRPKPRALSKPLHEKPLRQSAGSKAPLQMAKERRQEWSKADAQSTHTNGWLPNLRAASVEELSSADDEAPAKPGKSSKANQPRRTFSRSSKDGSEKQWDWLLRDESSSDSRSPSPTTNFDRS